MVRTVEAKALPAFLRQITYFSPKGNPTAEVVSELNRRLQTATRDADHSRGDRSARAKAYFSEELKDRPDEFARAGAGSAIRYRILQTFTVVCALAIPITLYFPSGDLDTRPIAAVLGAVLVVLVVLGVLGNYQVGAFRYRLAAERMNRERRKYVNFTAPYTAGLGENRAYELFVDSVEQILQDEDRL